MPSTHSAVAYALHTLSLFSVISTAITPAHAHAHSRDNMLLAPVRRQARAAVEKRAETYVGCYSSSTGLSDQGAYLYQTPDYCEPICVGLNQAVLALSGGSDCWCGASLPPTDTKVSDSHCNTPCQGYGSIMCGGAGYYSVYTTGTGSVVAAGSSASSAASSSSSSTSTTSPDTPSATSTSSSSSSTSSSSDDDTSPTNTASVVTSLTPGTTVVVTQPASQVASSTSTPTGSSSGGKTNVAGVAAGAVVGVVLGVGAIVGLIFFFKNKRRKEAESEFKRTTQVSSFIKGRRESRPPMSGYSNMSDSRLDPEAGARRNSVGSIADDQDYSRKILRVANPDRQ